MISSNKHRISLVKSLSIVAKCLPISPPFLRLVSTYIYPYHILSSSQPSSPLSLCHTHSLPTLPSFFNTHLNPLSLSLPFITRLFQTLVVCLCMCFCMCCGVFVYLFWCVFWCVCACVHVCLCVCVLVWLCTCYLLQQQVTQCIDSSYRLNYGNVEGWKCSQVHGKVISSSHPFIHYIITIQRIIESEIWSPGVRAEDSRSEGR